MTKDGPARYLVEHMPNGLIYVLDNASKLAGCYNADGTYLHGDLRAPTLAELLDRADVTTEEPLEAQDSTSQAYAQWLAAKRAQAITMRRVRLAIIVICILIGLWLVLEPFISAGV
jgi:hypothetical protein